MPLVSFLAAPMVEPAAMSTEYAEMRVVELRAILQELRLSQQAAAKLLGISHRSLQTYALGEVPIPAPTATLFRLLVRKVITEEQLIEAKSTAPST